MATTGTPNICDEAAALPSTSPTVHPTQRPYLGCMTRARSQIVDPFAPGFYHCVSRCVRRAWLCGLDPYSKRCFEHRRQWVEDRLLELADIFAVALHAYAVMSNHLHVVLQIDPGAPAQWTDEEVADRWVRLFAVSSNGTIDPHACALKRAALLGNAERLAQCRERLGDLGWFMRCLNEPIARRANAEEGCTGRFWEGRYKCQALLDDTAVLACMSYVDLNPVRAGMATGLGDSTHTGAASRAANFEVETRHAFVGLAPVRGSINATRLPLRTDQYLDLLDWTGRQLRADKAGAISPDTPRILDQLGVETRAWSLQVKGIESRYWRAVGSADALLAKAEAIGQRWLKGLGGARALVRAT
jgi:hypothetical protein